MKKWLWKLIQLVLSVASPEIRKMCCEMLKEMEAKAAATDNPWDDVLVQLLQTVLDCPEN